MSHHRLICKYPLIPEDSSRERRAKGDTAVTRIRSTSHEPVLSALRVLRPCPRGVGRRCRCCQLKASRGTRELKAAFQAAVQGSTGTGQEHGRLGVGLGRTRGAQSGLGLFITSLQTREEQLSHHWEETHVFVFTRTAVGDQPAPPRRGALYSVVWLWPCSVTALCVSLVNHDSFSQK